MRNTFHLLPLVLLMASGTAFAAGADDADFVLRKGVDGKVEFLTDAPAKASNASSVSPATSNPVVSSTATDPSSNASFARTTGLVLVLSGIILLLIFYRKRNSSPTNAEQRKMQLLERLPLGPRLELLMVRACDRVLVIGCHGNQLSLISDLARDVEPGSASFSQRLVERGVEDVPVTPVEVATPAPAKIPPMSILADTIAISAEARRKEWPEVKGAS